MLVYTVSFAHFVQILVPAVNKIAHQSNEV